MVHESPPVRVAAPMRRPASRWDIAATWRNAGHGWRTLSPTWGARLRFGWAPDKARSMGPLATVHVIIAATCDVLPRKNLSESCAKALQILPLPWRFQTRVVALKSLLVAICGRTHRMLPGDREPSVNAPLQHPAPWQTPGDVPAQMPALACSGPHTARMAWSRRAQLGPSTRFRTRDGLAGPTLPAPTLPAPWRSNPTVPVLQFLDHRLAARHTHP